MTTEIVKVQRRLDDHQDVRVLVYDQSRNRSSIQSVHSDIINIMRKRSGAYAFKAFFEAEWDAAWHMWKIGKLVRDQTW